MKAAGLIQPAAATWVPRPGCRDLGAAVRFAVHDRPRAATYLPQQDDDFPELNSVLNSTPS